MNPLDFRGNDWPTLGVELELQLVDATTMALTDAVDPVLAALPAEVRDAVKPEFLQCYVEINSDVGRTVADIGVDLDRKVRAVAQAAGRHGVRLLWGATHPFSHWREQAITPNARYHELAELLQETVRRPVTFGLHVHVGVDSGDTAVRVGNRLQEHLPTLLALSANSPFWCGRATGLHAHRIELLEGFPTGGLPPLFRDWGQYVAVVERMAGFGFIQTEKELWWDVRPNCNQGTVEVRICDMPPDLPSVLGLTALIQCLVADLAWGSDGEPDADEFSSLFLRQNRWRAARFGRGARLVDLQTGRAAPVPEVVKRLVDRLGSVAEQLGCSRSLEQVLALAEGPNGAERQLALFERTGDLAEVVRHQIEGRSPGPGSSSLVGPDPAILSGLGADPRSWRSPALVSNTRGLVSLR